MSQTQAPALALMPMIIPNLPIELSFDPAKSTKLAKVFANPLAWKIWLLWKPRHIVNQHFDDECVELAEAIDELKPATAEELSRIMASRSPYSNFHGSNTAQFWTEAAPFLIGGQAVETVAEMEGQP